MGWVGGNSECAVPIVKYVVKISHKGLLLWSYSDYQKELSDKVLDLRDRGKLTFNAIAKKLILEGYRSPRGFDLGAESVFSIYKKRNIRDARMNYTMMTNTHYLGHYIYTDGVSGEKVEVSCPKLIDEVTWNSINLERKRKASRKDQQNATTKNFYLLRDFMVCGHCGRKMAGRIKPAKNEYMYYCPNKERAWAKEGESSTHYERGTGCGFDRAMNIQLTDNAVFDTVVKLHKNSSILKEEVKKRVYAEHGIKGTAASAEEMKGYERQLRKHETIFQNLQESIGHLEANRILKRMDDKAYKTAVARMNEEADRLKTEITNLRLKLRGEAEKKQWVYWMDNFGVEIEQKKKLTDEQRQLYLKGLIEKIEAKFNSKTRAHELKIHFQHPIVGDGIKWNDPKKKTLGYKVLKGSKTTSVQVEKRDGRGK